MTYPAIHDPSHLYFMTATVIGWKRIFYDHKYAMIVLNSLGWMRNRARMKLFAFVLMPSHLHILMKPIGISVRELARQFGSYTAHAIVDQLKLDQRDTLLRFFHENRRYLHSNYGIWQDIQSQNVFSRDFLEDKLEYIHQNPINKTWSLVDDRAHYVYSSACYYDRGDAPLIPVDDVRDWLERC